MRGDRRLLGRMIRNLLENARRHGAPPIEVAVRGDGARAVIEVTDGGKGVPEAERERVFTPFHRLAGDTEGRGARARAGAADRPAAWRRRGGCAKARASELLPGQPA